MTTNNSSSSGGVSVCGLMGVMFIGLKIAGIIGWPWVWVLAPFWAPLAIAIVILLVAAIIIAITEK
jgi:hypothetical protein